MSAHLVLLHLERELVRAELRERGRLRWQAEAPYAGAIDLAEVVAGLVGSEAIPPGTRAMVVVRSPLLQVRRLSGLPRLGAADLSALVGMHPGRYFRKNGKPLVATVAWLDRGRTEAVAVALEEPYAEAMVEGVRSAGLRLGDLISEADGLPPLSLLPAAERERRRRSADRWVRRGGLLAAGVWAGVLVIGGGWMWRESKRIDRELAELRDPVEAVLAVEREASQAAAAVAAVEAGSAVRLGPVRDLIGIVSALPDSAWLASASVREDGRGSLSGWATQPAHVRSAVQRVPGVLAPRFDGRGTAEVVAGRRVERFTIRFGPAEAP